MSKDSIMKKQRETFHDEMSADLHGLIGKISAEMSSQVAKTAKPMEAYEVEIRLDMKLRGKDTKASFVRNENVTIWKDEEERLKTMEGMDDLG